MEKDCIGRLIFWWIDRHKICLSPSVELVTGHIIDYMSVVDLPEYNVPSQGKYYQGLKDHIKVILCNLISAAGDACDIWIGFRKDNNAYKKVWKKKGFQFSSRNLNKVSRFLFDYGFIDLKTGYSESKEWKGEVSKMRATSKLIALVESFVKQDIPVSDRSCLPGNCNTPLVIKKDYTHVTPIIMKGKKYQKKVMGRDGKPYKKWIRDELDIPFRYRNKAKALGDNVQEINAVLDKAEIDIDIDLHGLEELNKTLDRDPDENKKPIDLSNKSLHRVFHDGCFDQHGRWYGSWPMGIPEEYREKIIIGGMPTVEFDFKSLHPSMLYCLAEHNIPQEGLYTLPEHPDDPSDPDRPYQSFFKEIMLIMINSKGDDSTFKALVRNWTKKKMKAERKGEIILGPPIPLKKVKILSIIKLIREKHKPIERYFDDDGIGNVLMNYDSQIAERVLLHFARKGVPSLPVHDSFIVPVDHADECFEVMQTAFKDILGQYPRITGSEFKAIKDAMERTAVMDRSTKWNRLEAKVTYLSKVDFQDM